MCGRKVTIGTAGSGASNVPTNVTCKSCLRMMPAVLERNMVVAANQERTGPSIRRGSSRQDYQTPPEFLDAVARRFGPIAFDLAASASNAVAPRWYGPDHPYEGCRDALAQDWSALPNVLWLNPPFGAIEPWAAKCAAARHRAGWTLLLTPASIGSRWFDRHVKDQALVLGLRSRLTFVGETTPYPKDLMLACFGFGVRGFDTWDWKASRP